MTNLDNINVEGCWDETEFRHAGVQATGRSGGLLSIWDATIYNVSEVIQSRHFLITIGNWVGIPGSTIVANVYRPHVAQEKRKLWEDLARIKAEKTGTWIMFGDFNTVRSREERYNSYFCSSSAYWFNRFIDSSGFHDLRMGGFRYTFLCQSEFKLSKLDRYLVCNNFVSLFPATSITALHRELSDHCPVVLQTAAADFGKPPFRFFNSWMEREGFDQIIARAWDNFAGYGTTDAYVAAKFRFLKKEIRKWRATDYPKEIADSNRVKQRVHELDTIAEQRELSDEEREERRTGFQKITELEKLAILDLKQKSRIKWAVDGDENTRFFHGFVNNNKRKNRINGLMIEGTWNTNVEEIKQEVFNFYKHKFKEEWKDRPKLINPNFRRLDQTESLDLERTFNHPIDRQECIGPNSILLNGFYHRSQYR